MELLFVPLIKLPVDESYLRELNEAQQNAFLISVAMKTVSNCVYIVRWIWQEFQCSAGFLTLNIY
jgi:hypothetical protein